MSRRRMQRIVSQLGKEVNSCGWRYVASWRAVQHAKVDQAKAEPSNYELLLKISRKEAHEAIVVAQRITSVFLWADKQSAGVSPAFTELTKI